LGVLPAHIPSPSEGVIHLGPVPIRAYALCIIAGVVVATIVGQRRLEKRGGRKGAIADVATWAVPFGLVGARLYHLATNSELYWGGPGRSGTIGALEIWHGGLGIWGGVLFGALGAWIACRRYDLNYAVVADSLAPAMPLAQAIGRWGNWFNQELYGRPTSLPWGLHIDLANRMPGYLNVAYYQPTFLYESIWDIGVAVVVVIADRRHRFTKGRAFALYVMLYTIGRGWVEALRIDTAHRFLGLRLNDWTALIVFICATVYFFVRRPDGEPTDSDDAADAVDSDVVEAPEGHTLTT
jgi:prolipoprotein diacylglyceryl transferase